MKQPAGISLEGASSPDHFSRYVSALHQGYEGLQTIRSQPAYTIPERFRDLHVPVSTDKTKGLNEIVNGVNLYQTNQKL